MIHLIGYIFKYIMYNYLFYYFMFKIFMHYWTKYNKSKYVYLTPVNLLGNVLAIFSLTLNLYAT